PTQPPYLSLRSNCPRRRLLPLPITTANLRFQPPALPLSTTLTRRQALSPRLSLVPLAASNPPPAANSNPPTRPPPRRSTPSIPPPSSFTLPFSDPPLPLFSPPPPPAEASPPNRRLPPTSTAAIPSRPSPANLDF
ncbi:hypothetical protein LINPERPRIM_LOCUS22638, partial [Linum perenne]